MTGAPARLVLVSPQAAATLLLERDSKLRLAASPPAASTGDITLVAGLDLSGHRCVYLAAGTDTAQLASSDQAGGCQTLVGVTLGAAAQGALVVARRFGLIDDPSFSFVPGNVYLGLAGALTQTPPTSGTRQQVGLALTATKLFVHVRHPVMLASPS